MQLDAVRPTWILFGWFIAVAVVGLVLLGLVALGVLQGQAPSNEPFWIAGALGLGFLAGGFVVGSRAGDAPVLHGLGIGLCSVLAWLALNLFFGEPTGQTAWSELDAGSVVALLVLQTVAAIVGARLGVRWTRTARS